MIVVLNKGNVTQFIIEDTSSLCPTNTTREPVIDMGFNVVAQNNASNCPLPFCADSNANADGLCDAKFFIAWMGTDASGASLISSSSRWMALKDYNFPDLYSSLILVSNRASSTDTYLGDLTELDADVNHSVANPPPTKLTDISWNGTVVPAANTATV